MNQPEDERFYKTTKYWGWEKSTKVMADKFYHNEKLLHIISFVYVK